MGYLDGDISPTKMSIREGSIQIICSECGDPYMTRAFEPANNNMCMACRKGLNQAHLVDSVALEDIITVGVLADAFELPEPVVLGTARRLKLARHADDEISLEAYDLIEQAIGERLDADY